MPLPIEQGAIPTSIGSINLRLTDPNGVHADRNARYSIEILDQDGTIMRKISGDLVPHLTAPQIAALQTFLDDIRVLAQTALPAP